MKQPAKNRPTGGMGKPTKVKGSAGQAMGAKGKLCSGGTAYKQADGKSAGDRGPGKY